MLHVCIEQEQGIEYPDEKYGFAPSEKFPEYPWNDISPEKNSVYEMVRRCLHDYKLDDENYGTERWNPLGDIIKRGDTVVLKPNWVEDKNEHRRYSIECLVTHASVIRAMIDYVWIALNNTGRIIIGDSPMPDCNWDNLMSCAHYDDIWQSCRNRSIDFEVIDFREDIVTGFANEVKKASINQEVIVDLGSDSFFSETEHNVGKYRNGIVDATRMNQFYHAGGHHRYGICKTVLEANVIINLPKPKTHRKAGYTAALKNYIGICSRKISIPHNVMGNEKEGGDTYYGPKIVFETEQQIRDMQNRAQSNGHRIRGFCLKTLRIPFWLFRRATHKWFFGTGNWYKNDTIWRSILDLNRIMVYADKQGILQSIPQRRFFSLGDMIVAGHRNGPLAPTPIKTCCLVCSENPVAFDLAVIKLMGLNSEFLPVIQNALEIKHYPIIKYQNEKILIRSNLEMLNNKSLDEIATAPFGFFQPAEGWEIISLKTT